MIYTWDNVITSTFYLHNLVLVLNIEIYSKIVWRGHLWEKKSFNTCDILKKPVLFIWFAYDRTRQHGYFNTGDRLIGVIRWPDLTVCEILPTWQQVHQNYHIGFLLCKKQTYNTIYISKFILQIIYISYLCLKWNVPN